MKARLLFSLILISFIGFKSFGQTDFQQNSSFLDRVYTGGGMGFSFGSFASSVSISPIVGYMITERLSAGVGLTYQYNNFKTIDVSTSNYGFSLFGRYNLTQQLFLYTEYEYLNFEFIDVTNIDNSERQGFSSYFGGLGYAIPIGRNAAFVVTGLYNFAWNANDNNTPYDSPWLFRGGLTIGF